MNRAECSHPGVVTAARCGGTPAVIPVVIPVVIAAAGPVRDTLGVGFPRFSGQSGP